MNPKYYDNIDDKKEIYNIIERHMDERLREEFLLWCCQAVNTPLSTVLRPGINSTYHPKEVFWQFWNLVLMHNLNINTAVNKLVEVARKGKVCQDI